MKNKAQSEFVGFAIIIIIVMILILVFLTISFSNSSDDDVQNYESELFVQAILSYTSDCVDSGNYLTIEKMIKQCNSGKTCSGETKTSCEILNETLKDMISSAWKVGENSPSKGYEFQIDYMGNTITNITQGIKTNQNKGTTQVFGTDTQIFFTVYY